MSEFGAGDEILLLLRVYQVAVGTLPGLGSRFEVELQLGCR